MRSFEQYDINEVQKHLQLHDLDVEGYITDKYALWLDFRTIDKNTLHGMGRGIGSMGGGIILQIEKQSRNGWRAQGLHLPNHGCPVEHSEWSICFYCALEK